MKKIQRYEAYPKVCDDGRVIIEYIPTHNGRVYLVNDVIDAKMSELYHIYSKDITHD